MLEAEFSLEQQERLKKLQAQALQLLSRREHGDLELAYKLKLKCQTEDSEADLVDFVLKTCQKNAWQSDERYIEAYVNQAMQKGHGELKIRQALYGKTSQTEIVDRYLDIGDEDWIELAQAVLDKKYGDHKQPNARNEQAKRMRFLLSRGFNQNQIYKAFKS